MPPAAAPATLFLACRDCGARLNLPAEPMACPDCGGELRRFGYRIGTATPVPRRPRRPRRDHA